MKRMISILIALLLLLNNRLPAQKVFWEMPDAYLGQKPPSNIPEVFAKGLLVDSGIVLSRVAFSKNGKEFYYTYAKHWFDDKGSGVKRVVFDGKKWTRPETICQELSNPTFSINDNTLYFGGKVNAVWKTTRVNNGWTKPTKYLDLPYGLYNFTPTKSGNIYVGSNGSRSNKDDYGAYDFSIMTLKDRVASINSLGGPLNTSGFDGDFYIAPNESYIIISTNETPTFDCDLYISFRSKNKTWTNPVSLGDKINDGVAHRFGQYVSPDGKYLFYTRGTKEEDTNIYWVRFDSLVQKLKKD